MTPVLKLSPPPHSFYVEDLLYDCLYLVCEFNQSGYQYIVQLEVSSKWQ
jgi:hypothetical protein